MGFLGQTVSRFLQGEASARARGTSSVTNCPCAGRVSATEFALKLEVSLPRVGLSPLLWSLLDLVAWSGAVSESPMTLLGLLVGIFEGPLSAELGGRSGGE